nr:MULTISPECIES: hypothetical protein [unclassified Streptomyces]
MLLLRVLRVLRATVLLRVWRATVRLRGVGGGLRSAVLLRRMDGLLGSTGPTVLLSRVPLRPRPARVLLLRYAVRGARRLGRLPVRRPRAVPRVLPRSSGRGARLLAHGGQ